MKSLGGGCEMILDSFRAFNRIGFPWRHQWKLRITLFVFTSFHLADSSKSLPVTSLKDQVRDILQRRSDSMGPQTSLYPFQHSTCLSCSYIKGQAHTAVLDSFDIWSAVQRNPTDCIIYLLNSSTALSFLLSSWPVLTGCRCNYVQLKTKN